jgi:hypothetical protein
MTDHIDESERLDEVIRAALPATLSSNGLNLSDLAALARDLILNLRELPATLTAHKITQEQYDKIKENEFFKRALEHLTLEWHSANSTTDRLKIQAAASFEYALPTITARMVKNDEDLGKVVEAGKLLAKVAGVDSSEAQAASNPGEKFVINIDLGQDHKLRFEKDVTPAIPLIEKEKPNEPA